MGKYLTPLSPAEANLTCEYSQLPTSADREAYEQLKNQVPSTATHPNLFAWWVLIGRFNESVRNTWAGAQAAPAKGAEKKPAAPAKKEEPKKTEAKADDDEMDLFGDDDEDDAVCPNLSIK